jgi:HD-like signal output (HDOD) protein
MAASTPTREKILSLAKDLPPAAAVLGKLQRLLTDPNATLDDICGLLKRDIALSSRILRISNSTYFSPATPNASLEEAVGYMGYAEVYKVVGITIASQCWCKDLRFYGYTPDQLWQNAISSALAMESLAQFVGLNPRSTYTAGLMRSMGKIILDRCASESVAPPEPFAQENGKPLGAWEVAAFGSDNPTVAALVLREWNFATETCEAVLHQYHPEASPDGELTPWLVNLAGWITLELGCGLAGEDSYWALRPETLARTELAAADLELCTAETKMAVDAVRRAFADFS